MKIFARLLLPFGLFYLFLALGWIGWLLASGASAGQFVTVILALPIAVLLIWQGRQFRRDARIPQRRDGNVRDWRAVAHE
jgi:membrane protein implicated in regulation of membrane protease activity